MDIIKEKQLLWAMRNGKNLRTDYYLYTSTVKENLFKDLSPTTKKEFNDAKGGELNETEKHPAKMTALFSSSALCVNVFQYFQDKSKELKLELLRACKLISNDYDCDDVVIKFECTDYKICNGKNIISNPNIDVVIVTTREGKEDRIFAIESKFTEPYNNTAHDFLAKKYYENGGNTFYWKSMGDLYYKLGIDDIEEVTIGGVSGKIIPELAKSNYGYLNALQLIKHLMGVRGTWKNKNKVKLVYVFYDALSTVGKEHREEIKKFNDFIEDSTGVAFNYISYQELICNLMSHLPYDEHKEYLDYIAERYL